MVRSRRRPRQSCACHVLLLAASLAALFAASAAHAGWFGDLFREFDAETFHDDVSQKVLDTANSIDEMFGAERIDDEAQKTRVRAYTDIEWDEEDGTDVGAKVRVHLVLPGTKDRLRLDFNGADDEDSVSEDIDDEIESTGERERSAGINLAARQTRRTKTDVGIGLRHRDSSYKLYEKARHRVYFRGDKWLPRLTNEVRHYGDTGWQYRGQLDFDRAFSDDWFMRTRSELRWYENQDTDEEDLRCNDGYCVNQFFFLYQRFANPNHAIAYDWLNYFVTEPDTQLDELQLRVRYRHRLYWDWLHVEVQPKLRFREEEDYDGHFSLLFRVEGIFGYDPQAEVQFNEVESIEQATEEQPAAN